MPQLGSSRTSGKDIFPHFRFLQTVHKRRRSAKSTRWIFLAVHSCDSQVSSSLEEVVWTYGQRTEQTAGPNNSWAHAGSDISSGGSGTFVAPAFRRATIQTEIVFRDIKTCRRVRLVRARFRRSIGRNAENIYGKIEFRDYRIITRTYHKKNVQRESQHVLQPALDPVTGATPLAFRGRRRRIIQPAAFRHGSLRPVCQRVHDK